LQHAIHLLANAAILPIDGEGLRIGNWGLGLRKKLGYASLTQPTALIAFSWVTPLANGLNRMAYRKNQSLIVVDSNILEKKTSHYD
jgi:hypothetical protein